MCLKKRRGSMFRTVTFRLTLWYTALFGVLSLVVFLLVYVSLTSHLREQTDNELLSTAKEFEALYENQGVKALRSEFLREAKSRGTGRVFFRLLSPEGEVLAASDLDPWNGLKSLPILANSISEKQPAFQMLSLPGYSHKVKVLRNPTRDGRVIELGTTILDTEIMMKKYRETFEMAMAVMLVCGGFVGWLLARRAMSGVQRVTHTATQIGKYDLALRVPLSWEGEEIDALAHAFNDMLERIESLVKELKEVTDSVAHDLRSPITRIRGVAETTLTSGRDIKDFREMAATVIEESDRLDGMINTMLEITKADSGVAELASDLLDVRHIVEEAADLFQPLAEDKGINIKMCIPSRPVFITADRARLQRAVSNLLDNAIKYTPQDGKVTISIDTDATRTSIAISDTGTGIGAKDIPRIFDRFYRGDESRSTSGSGLGLSLALAIIRAHGGDISVTSSPGRGSRFTVILPRTSSET